jgi:hypothetical protein
MGARISGGALSDGRLSFGVRVISGEKVIEQPDPDTITFDLRGEGYFIVLKRDATSKRYLLTVKKENYVVINNFALVYLDKEGFISEATPPVRDDIKFSTKITFDAVGGHTWFIRQDLTITFRKPENP